MASSSLGSSPKKLKQSKDSSEDFTTSGSTTVESMIDAPLSPLKSSGSGSRNSDDLSECDSDSSYYGDIISDNDEDSAYDNETLSLQAQFDAVDLPPGVEVSIPWMEKSSRSDYPSTSNSPISNQLSSQSGEEKKDEVEIRLQLPSGSLIKQTGASSSTVLGQLSSNNENEEKDETDVMNSYKQFKQFDMVQDFSDHHFMEGDSKPKQASQQWTKTIQQEWQMLEKGLPDKIFVRVSEERMDLMRAVIVGSAGTPYHDGLFFFDVLFPPAYPDTPPQVFYYSGGLRLNPNLYNCGKVCLSLLNTWHGQKNEQWTPGNSTVLQVLLSIQALVLNEKPYFNEPGYESSAGTGKGEKKSKDYNEETFILSCKTMLYTLRRPPKHYESFVLGHFRVRAHPILRACKAYMEGTEVGELLGETGQDMGEDAKKVSQKLKHDVSKVLPRLVQAFTRNGTKDCEQFLPTQS